jgi:hypothetical protein
MVAESAAGRQACPRPRLLVRHGIPPGHGLSAGRRALPAGHRTRRGLLPRRRGRTLPEGPGARHERHTRLLRRPAGIERRGAARRARRHGHCADPQPRGRSPRWSRSSRRAPPPNSSACAPRPSCAAPANASRACSPSAPRRSPSAASPTGRFADVNPAFERPSAGRRQEMLGRSALDIGIWPSARGARGAGSRNSRQTIGPGISKPSCSRATGEPLTVLLSAAAIDLEGRAAPDRLCA